MFRICSECSETWKELKTPGCWPNVFTLVNTQMNFPYQTESFSRHVDHFKPIKNFLKKMLGKNYLFVELGMAKVDLYKSTVDTEVL